MGLSLRASSVPQGINKRNIALYPLNAPPPQSTVVSSKTAWLTIVWYAARVHAF